MLDKLRGLFCMPDHNTVKAEALANARRDLIQHEMAADYHLAMADVQRKTIARYSESRGAA